MPKDTQATVSPLDAHLGFWLRFVSNHVSGRFQKLLEAQGVSVTEWVALRTLLDKPETAHADLIAALGMTKGATSKVVSKLEEKELVVRRLAEGSAREQVLALSPEGRALVPRLAELADQNDEHFFGHLGLQERQALMQTFQRLVEYHQFNEVPVA